jgi:hypothetical protein
MVQDLALHLLRVRVGARLAGLFRAPGPLPARVLGVLPSRGRLCRALARRRPGPRYLRELALSF